MRKCKLVSVLLCFVLCVGLFASCSKQRIAMEYDGHYVTANMYSYWLSQIKSGYVSSDNDTDEYWDTTYSNGGTYEEKMREIVDFNVKVNLVCTKIFDDLGLKVTADEKSEIDTAISDLLASYGSKSELNSMLSNYNINVDILEDIYTVDLKASKVFEALYAENGSRRIDDEKLEAYYKENYSRMDVIFIYCDYEYKKDEDGKLIFNDLTNTYEKEALDEEASNAKKSLAEDIYKRVSAGEDFDELKKKFNEYPDGDKYELGYFISANDVESYGTEFYTAVSQMEINDAKKIESDGVVCIIKRMELTEKPYTDENYLEMFENLVDYCEEADFNSYMAELVTGVTVYEDEVSKYSVRDAALMG